MGKRAYALVASDLESRGFLAAFSERTGGVSAGSFAALNLSFSVGDDPAAVRENRRRLARGLALSSFALAGLSHGARVARVGRGRSGAGFEDPAGVVPGADALVASSPEVAVSVTTADCVPLVLASSAEGRVAVVHAGWRGLAKGIIAGVLRSFERPADVLAAVGPAIGPCHYEVGEDVALAVAAATGTGAVTRRAGGRLFLDLPATTVRQLRNAGVRRIGVAELCTACERGRFFSHRRDGTTGRQAAVAVRLT